VPEATVDEDGEPSGGEDDVRADLEAWGLDLEVLPKAKPLAVEGGA
jgi:hypothetical protein